jgi:hypothetical protein
MIDPALALFAMTLGQVRDTVKDIPDARAAEMPGGVRNHPAWTLAHLCTGAAYILILLDEPAPADTTEMFAKYGPGSTPVADRAAYRPMSADLTLLAELHERAVAAVRAKHAAYFTRQSPDELRSFAPTIGDAVFYLLTAHESYHLGQLVVWKRAAGLVK